MLWIWTSLNMLSFGKELSYVLNLTWCSENTSSIGAASVAKPPRCSTLYRLIEWCFAPLSTIFQSYHGDSSHYSCLSWVSPVLGSGSEVSCPRTLSRKTQRIQCCSNPGPWITSQTLYHWATQDPFFHYQTMPHFDTLNIYSCRKHCEKRRNCKQFLLFSQCFLPYTALLFSF